MNTLKDKAMKTKTFDVTDIIDDKRLLETRLKEAAEMLAEGRTVAFPTETVYGLGANALDESAVKKIYEAKGRPSDNPLIVHVAEFSQLSDIVEEVPEKAEKLMKAFWPGPVSIIMRRKNTIPDCVTAGLDTVAVRMPENAEAFVLLKLAGCPVAAPSANISGKPSPTRPEHVLHDLEGRVSGIVAGRCCEVGIESTVIDVTSEPPVILRPGIITKEEIESVIGPVLMAPRKSTVKNIPKAPGMKYTHYAPDAPMILYEGTPEKMFGDICEAALESLSKGVKTGIIATDETIDSYEKILSEKAAGADYAVLSIGSRSDLNMVARGVFDVLRRFDEMEVGIILAESFDAEGVGFSIMNRMDKAATEIR